MPRHRWRAGDNLWSQLSLSTGWVSGLATSTFNHLVISLALGFLARPGPFLFPWSPPEATSSLPFMSSLIPMDSTS